MHLFFSKRGTVFLKFENCGTCAGLERASPFPSPIISSFPFLKDPITSFLFLHSFVLPTHLASLSLSCPPSSAFPVFVPQVASPWGIFCAMLAAGPVVWSSLFSLYFPCHTVSSLPPHSNAIFSPYYASIPIHQPFICPHLP